TAALNSNKRKIAESAAGLRCSELKRNALLGDKPVLSLVLSAAPATGAGRRRMRVPYCGLPIVIGRRPRYRDGRLRSGHVAGSNRRRASRALRADDEPFEIALRHVVEALHLHDDVVGEARRQGGERDPRFEARERGADAVVDSVAER